MDGDDEYDELILDFLSEQGYVDEASKPFLKKTPEVVKLAGAFNEFYRRHPDISEEEISLLLGLLHRLHLTLMDSENRVDNR